MPDVILNLIDSFNFISDTLKDQIRSTLLPVLISSPVHTGFKNNLASYLKIEEMPVPK